jgi:hypothetical protein
MFVDSSIKAVCSAKGGMALCPTDWETRHPQDLIKLPQERPAPPYTRPVPADEFIVVAPVDPESVHDGYNTTYILDDSGNPILTDQQQNTIVYQNP